MASLISMSRLMHRPALAIALAVVGGILGVVAGVGFLAEQSDSGDTTAVELSLTTELDSVTTTTTTPNTTTTTVPTPLWSANELSLLADLEMTSGGPRPERLVIEALSIDAPVGEYGVVSNGQMDVPNNIIEVGWYKFGPSPG